MQSQSVALSICLENQKLSFRDPETMMFDFCALGSLFIKYINIH